MAIVASLSLSLSAASAIPRPIIPIISIPPFNAAKSLSNQRRPRIINCESSSSAADENEILPAKTKSLKLEIGSPVIVIEAPKMVKTADSIICLRVNSGLVNSGDVGRIVSRKPKDVWAVRFKVGTFLMDGKYFRPLELD